MNAIQPIILPGAENSAPFAAGVKVGTTFRSSALAAPSPAALSVQAEQIYAQLSLALAQAGASWRDVVKINQYHAGPIPSGAERCALHQIVARHVPPEQASGMDLQIGPMPEGCRLLVEVVAEIGVPRQLLGDTSLEGPGLAWAQGVRTGNKVYLSGRREPGAGYHNRDTLGDQTAAIYAGFRALLQQAGMTRHDIIRVRQFIADEAADFNLVRAGRQEHVPTGYFTSTSVAVPRSIAASPDEAWLLTAELEAETGPTVALSTSQVADTPGVPHAIRIGDHLHLQASIAIDATGTVCHKGDVRGQTQHLLAAFDAVLAAAGASWREVVYSRVFCRHAEDLAVVRAMEAAHARGASYARAELVAGFFDPAVLVEIELVAAAR